MMNMKSELLRIWLGRGDGGRVEAAASVRRAAVGFQGASVLGLVVLIFFLFGNTVVFATPMPRHSGRVASGTVVPGGIYGASPQKGGWARQGVLQRSFVALVEAARAEADHEVCGLDLSRQARNARRANAQQQAFAQAASSLDSCPDWWAEQTESCWDICEQRFPQEDLFGLLDASEGLRFEAIVEAENQRPLCSWALIEAVEVCGCECVLEILG